MSGLCVFLLFSDGGNTIDPAFEAKIRAKVADVFPFMNEKGVSEHYRMVEQVLEDEKMVGLERINFSSEENSFGSMYM